MTEELKNAIKTIVEAAKDGVQFQFTGADGVAIAIVPTNAQFVESLDGTKLVQIW